MCCNGFRYLRIFKYLVSRYTLNISFEDDTVDGDYFLLVLYVSGTQVSEKMRKKGWDMGWIDQC